MINISSELTAHSDFTIPAVLSEVIIKKLLREKLGYDGIIMTNNLQDPLITEQYTVEEAAIRALEAGVDLLVLSSEDTEQIDVLEEINESVIAGRISEERIDKYIERIVQLKQDFDLREFIHFDRSEERR